MKILDLLNPRRWVGKITLFLGGLWLLFMLMNYLFPLPLEKESVLKSVVITDQKGTLLRAFLGKDGQWQQPITLSHVSPLYIEALLGYEDRWFRFHPGINPFSLIRAIWQAVTHGYVVSGGSTLTMQVARLIDPHQRNWLGKLHQMFRALQLEWIFSKDQILTLYLNRAPFGGPLQGIQAASFAYLGKNPDRLSHAEAALLAVLPQAPTRLRPDQNPKGAQQARDKVLKRMQTFHYWSQSVVEDAKLERVSQSYHPHPMIAPLLSRRLKKTSEKNRRVVSSLDVNLQRSLEAMVVDITSNLAEKNSLAIMVMDNKTLLVRAYVGSAHFYNSMRFGHVDMVQAIRSPGSTLKPFLYGMALDGGFIHSESLMVDAPQSFDTYRPNNFGGGYHGPVSVREALQKSLNIPAVDLLERFGPKRFVAGLRHGGLKLSLPGDGMPNLSVILGGAGTNLESLVGAYASLARKGLSGKPRLTPSSPLQNHRILSPGSAWIIRKLLASADRPDIPSSSVERANQRRLAWKTGTSYGFRDAWAIGVTDRFTLGVWVGRPDGTPSPGQYGGITAAPILWDIIDGWPQRFWWEEIPQQPSTVSSVDICWPLGTQTSLQPSELCHIKRVAWTVNETTPPTLADRDRPSHGQGIVRYWSNPKTGLRVDANCSVTERRLNVQALWPLRLEPWLSDELLKKSRPPLPDPSCPQRPKIDLNDLRIIGLTNGVTLRSSLSGTPYPKINLSVLGGDGIVYWMIEGKVVAKQSMEKSFQWRFEQPGWHSITALDETGRFDRIRVQVVLGGGG